MIGYVIAFGVAIAASVLAFALFYAIHLWVSRREDERILRGDDEPVTQASDSRSAHRETRHPIHA